MRIAFEALTHGTISTNVKYSTTSRKAAPVAPHRSLAVPIDILLMAAYTQANRVLNCLVREGIMTQWKWSGPNT